MVTWYWSSDPLFWQVSIDHNMDVQNQRCKLETKTWYWLEYGCHVAQRHFRRWTHAPRYMALAMLTKKKSFTVFYFYACKWSSSNSYGALLGDTNCHLTCTRSIWIHTIFWYACQSTQFEVVNHQLQDNNNVINDKVPFIHKLTLW